MTPAKQTSQNYLKPRQNKTGQGRKGNGAQADPAATNEKGTRITTPYPGKFKTVMCRFWSQGKHCPFGLECNFAHGKSQLKPRDTVPQSAPLSAASPQSQTPPTTQSSSTRPADQSLASRSKIQVELFPKVNFGSSARDLISARQGLGPLEESKADQIYQQQRKGSDPMRHSHNYHSNERSLSMAKNDQQ